MDPLYSNLKLPCVESFDVIRNNYKHIKCHEDDYCIKLGNII